jgi:hypothetical protein
MEDNIDRIKDELEEARQSLHQTVTEVLVVGGLLGAALSEARNDGSCSRDQIATA